MDENTIIEQLEELIRGFGVQIRREPIKQDEDLVRVVGDLCRLKGEYVLIINSKATAMDRIWTLATALSLHSHSLSAPRIPSGFKGNISDPERTLAAGALQPRKIRLQISLQAQFGPFLDDSGKISACPTPIGSC